MVKAEILQFGRRLVAEPILVEQYIHAIIIRKIEYQKAARVRFRSQTYTLIRSTANAIIIVAQVVAQTDIDDLLDSARDVISQMCPLARVGHTAGDKSLHYHRAPQMNVTMV